MPTLPAKGTLQHRSGSSIIAVFVALLLVWSKAVIADSVLRADSSEAIAKAERSHPQQSPEMVSALVSVMQGLEKQRRYDEAIPVGERALQIAGFVYGPESFEVAELLFALGRLQELANRGALALVLYQRSLDIQERTLGPSHVYLATTLSYLAGLHETASRYVQALPLYQRSLSIYEKALSPDHLNVAAALNNLAELYRAMGRYELALPLHLRSLAIYEKTLGPHHVSVAVSLNNIAGLHSTAGEFTKALPLNERSLAIYERALGPDHVDVARSLNNLAEVHRALGQYPQALALHQRSLAIVETALGPNHLEVARSLGNLALVHSAVGHYSQALPLHERSLAIFETTLGSHHMSVAVSLSNLAMFYVHIGQYGQALPLTQRSLAIKQELLGSDHEEVALGLSDLAQAYEGLGQYRQALPVYQRSLAIAEKALGPDNASVALILNNLAVHHLRSGEFAQALPRLKRSLAIRERVFGPDHKDVASSLNSLAGLYLETGAYAQALPLFQRSLAIASATAGGEDLLWQVQGSLATFYQRQGDREVAIYWGKQSVNSLQALRGKLTTLDKELQSSFAKDRSWPYTRLADALIAEGRIPEAQQVLQMLKERELYDEVLRGEVPASRRQVDLTGLERAKFSEYYRIREQYVALANERRQLDAKKSTERTAAEMRRLAQINLTFERLDDTMKAFMAGLQSDLNKAAEGKDAPLDLKARVKSLTRIVDDLADPRGEPAARAVGLQYVVTDKRLSIILTLPGGKPIAHQVELDRVEFNRRITKITADMKNPRLVAMGGETGILAQAQELYRILIEPVLPQLKKAEARTLMISATDVLRYLPFAVLHNGKNYLVQDYALAVFNEAAQTEFRPTKKEWRIAGFGLSEAVPGQDALKAVPVELESILSRSPKGKSWLNRPFTRGQLGDAMKGDFEVLHLATHFVVQLGDTKASRLYLGDKSTMNLDQFTGVRFTGLELVTLSACETAIGGGRTSYGQEMESLSTQVQLQGAAAVIATLWKVADSSTGKLMARFYENKLAGSMNKAQALRNAQLALISGKERFSKGQDWAHPFYWAPFVLMGNWR